MGNEREINTGYQASEKDLKLSSRAISGLYSKPAPPKPSTGTSKPAGK